MIPLYMSIAVSVLFTLTFIMGFKQKWLYCPPAGFWHHFYLGSIIFLFTASHNNFIAIPALFIAAIIWIDDFEQHLMQVDNPTYQSSLHEFYVEYIWKHLDNFFKKFPWFYKNIWNKV